MGPVKWFRAPIYESGKMVAGANMGGGGAFSLKYLVKFVKYQSLVSVLFFIWFVSVRWCEMVVGGFYFHLWVLCVFGWCGVVVSVSGFVGDGCGFESVCGFLFFRDCDFFESGGFSFFAGFPSSRV